MNSFGVLPVAPKRASLLENADAAAAIWLFEGPKAATVNGSAYVKYAPKLRTGVANRIEIGPPLSETTLAPECGGNSNSLSEIPAERTIALVNVSPRNWFVTMSPSLRPSKLMT